MVRAPHPLTRLVGRAGQLAAVLALLGREDVRLVTLTGAGGIGKTRLAVAAAMATASTFADGAVFVDLAPLRDPDAVLPTIAAALDIRETGPKPLEHVVAEALASRRLLLLLDNFEHLMPAAPVVTGLLQAAPGITALVTSRQPLRVRGEREVAVPPLELPAPPTGGPSADAVRSEAVTLFVERAQDVRFDFTLTTDDIPAVAEIVTRLDGLPLAIELAATWSKTLTPPVLAARLERRLPLLSGGAQDAPVRHRTMRAAIAWSYDLLQPEEQALFRRLSVFVGGWTLDVVAALDSSDPRANRLDQLTRLVDQHLVQAQATPAGDLRYDMLATIREFAREQVIANGEERAACERHAAIVLDLAKDVVPHLYGPRQLESLARLAAEYDNLRAAIDWSLADGSVELATKFGAQLWLFWFLQGNWTEGRTWLRRVLALREEVPTLSAAEAAFGAGSLAGIQGDLNDTEGLLQPASYSGASSTRLRGLPAHFRGWVLLHSTPGSSNGQLRCSVRHCRFSSCPRTSRWPRSRPAVLVLRWSIWVTSMPDSLARKKVLRANKLSVKTGPQQLDWSCSRTSSCPKASTGAPRLYSPTR